MIEAKPGARFTVRDEPINRNNEFWRPLIGRSGTVMSVMSDGMLDVTIVIEADQGCFVEGVKPERLSLFDASSAVLPLFEPRPWWKRLMFWRRPLVKPRR